MSITVIKIAPVNPFARVPMQQSIGASGFDLTSCEELTIMPGKHKLVNTGLKVEFPRGYEAQIRPRSGLALKYGVTVLNAPGTIDSDYRGEVKVILINHGDEPFEVKRGERIAQMIICAVVMPRMDIVLQKTLTETVRGKGGFGSTG